MYTPKIHQLNLKQARGKPLSDDEMLLIDAMMTHHEQCTLGFSALKIEQMHSLEEKLIYANVMYDDFVKFIDATEDDMQRFKDGKVSEFEAKMLNYLICQCIYADDRTHCCQVCGKIFSAARDNDHLCDDCLGKLLMWMDHRTECLEW